MYWKCDGVRWGTATQGDCLLSGETDLLSLELEVLLLLSDLRSGNQGEDSLIYSTGFATGSLKLFHGWFLLGIFHHIGQNCNGLLRDLLVPLEGRLTWYCSCLWEGQELDLDDSDLGSEWEVGARNEVRLCWRFLPTFLCRVDHLNILIKLSSEQQESPLYLPLHRQEFVPGNPRERISRPAAFDLSRTQGLTRCKFNATIHHLPQIKRINSVQNQDNGTLHK